MSGVKTKSQSRLSYLRIKSDPERFSRRQQGVIRWRIKNSELNKIKAREKYARIKSDPDLYKKYLVSKYKRSRSLEGRIIGACRSRLNKITKSIKFSESTMELCGTSISGLRDHLQSQFKTGMSWENYGLKGWHIDHKIPCSSFDVSDINQLRSCFHYTNLQPLWAFDNESKGSKTN